MLCLTRAVAASHNGPGGMGSFASEQMATQRAEGLELKLARIRQGLHLYEVARRVGITPARLSQFEGGHRRLPPDLEEKLQAVLRLPRNRLDSDAEG